MPLRPYRIAYASRTVEIRASSPLMAATSVVAQFHRFARQGWSRPTLESVYEVQEVGSTTVHRILHADMLADATRRKSQLWK